MKAISQVKAPSQDSTVRAETDVEEQSALNEALYLLKRWKFAASAAGFLWVQPLGPRLAPEELAGFLALVKRGCRERFPRSMLFDFNEVEIVGAQWTTVESLLLEFAGSIGAKMRVVSSHRRAASAVILHRMDDAAAMMPSPTPHAA